MAAQALARALRAPEQVGEGIGVADVAENHPAALIRNPYLSSEPNKIPLVIKGESPILAEAWWPISAGYEYGTDASSAGAPASATWALRGPSPRLRAHGRPPRRAGTPPGAHPRP